MATAALPNPIGFRRIWSQRLADQLANAQWKENLMDTRIPDEGLGYDRFGLEQEATHLALGLFHRLYDAFDIESYGQENLPATPFIVTPNRVVPGLDTMLLSVDVLKARSKLIRPMVHPRIANVPYLNILLSRIGSVYAVVDNMNALVREQQSILVFPEQTTIRRTSRHQLQAFSPLVVELALHHSIPIVPVAIEHDYSRLVPWPQRVRIRYGAPLHVHELLPDPEQHTPIRLQTLADELQRQVQSLLRTFQHLGEHSP